jgi:hypothetical protein
MLDYMIRFSLLIAVILIFSLLGVQYTWDIRPALLYHADLLHTLSTLNLQQPIAPILHKQRIKLIKSDMQKNALMQVILCAEQNGLQAKLMDARHDLDGHTSVHFVVNGQLQQLFYFLESVQMLKYTILFNHLILSETHDALIQIEANLDVYFSYLEKNKRVLFDVEKLNKLFVNSDIALNNELNDVDEESSRDISSMPPRQLHYIGVVTKGSQKWMMLRLPNNEIYYAKA